MSELKRRENESEVQYGIRLYSNKALYGLSNAELHKMYCEETGDTRGESTIRGYFSNLIEGISIGIEQASNNDQVEEMNKKIKELERVKIKARTEKLELAKWNRIDTRNEMLYEAFKESLDSTYVPEFKDIIISNGKKEANLGISDFHFGKAFEVIGNTYNEEEFYKRMNQLAIEVISACKFHGISKLNVLNCGDDCEGMALRVSQLKSLQYGFTDQVIKLAKYMVKFLNKLSEEIEVVYHHVQEGNHSELRSFGDKTWTMENMERIIITYIRDMTENNPRITVPEYNGSFVNYNILGYEIFARHGHKKINEAKVIADSSMLLNKFIDVCYFGHLHHSKRKTTYSGKTHNKEVIYIPSIMGEDEYSQDFMFGGSKAGAILDIYEEGKGISCTHFINVN